MEADVNMLTLVIILILTVCLTGIAYAQMPGI